MQRDAVVLGNKSIAIKLRNFISKKMDQQVSGIEWQRPLKNAVSPLKHAECRTLESVGICHPIPPH